MRQADNRPTRRRYYAPPVSKLKKLIDELEEKYPGQLEMHLYTNVTFYEDPSDQRYDRLSIIRLKDAVERAVVCRVDASDDEYNLVRLKCIDFANGKDFKFKYE